MKQTNRELRQIIEEYGLTRQETAEMMMVKKSTVDRYLVPPTLGRGESGPFRNPTFRSMPAHRLKLLVNALRGRKKVMP